MRGHNIVVDGWAGAYNLHPYSPPSHARSHTQTIMTTSSKMRVFTLFESITTDQRNNGPMDQRMDKASYRVACLQLKRHDYESLNVYFLLDQRR